MTVTFSVDKFLEVFLAEALHQIELKFKYHHAIVSYLACVLSLSGEELSYLSYLFKERKSDIELSIEGNSLKSAINRIK